MKYKKYIVKVISVLIICTIIVVGKNQYTCLILKNANYGMPALIERSSVDKLYIGSSMFRQGIDINMLEDNRTKSYIMAYNGNQPALEYYELNNLIKQGVSINNLYIDMYAYSAWEEPEIDDEKIFLETDIQTKLSLYKLISYNSIQSERIWRMFVSSNNELLLFWPINSAIVNSQFKDGGTLTKTQCADRNVLEQMVAPSIEGEMNIVQKQFLIDIIELTNKNNINLTFVETPKYHNVGTDKNYLEAMKKYANVLEEKNVNYLLSTSTAEYIDNGLLEGIKKYDFDIFNNLYFMDNIHLSYEGRKEFTKLLCKLYTRK